MYVLQDAFEPLGGVVKTQNLRLGPRDLILEVWELAFLRSFQTMWVLLVWGSQVLRIESCPGPKEQTKTLYLKQNIAKHLKHFDASKSPLNMRRKPNNHEFCLLILL